MLEFAFKEAIDLKWRKIIGRTSTSCQFCQNFAHHRTHLESMTLRKDSKEMQLFLKTGTKNRCVMLNNGVFFAMAFTVLTENCRMQILNQINVYLHMCVHEIRLT